MPAELRDETGATARVLRTCQEFPESWPCDCEEAFPIIMAVARHHGLQTRLLDRTTDPYEAVRAAVSEALRMGEEAVANKD